MQKTKRFGKDFILVIIGQIISLFGNAVLRFALPLYLFDQTGSPTLLCGDVGVGKTEVALRAAFKCVMGGKQCAILAPTTLLAWQHYNTILSRMEAFPVKVEMMSRFRTAKQQKETLRGLQSGSVDIVVGTHRLLSKDVKFHDLGLVIIDEEHGEHLFYHYEKTFNAWRWFPSKFCY